MIKIFSLMFIVLAMAIPREKSSHFIDSDKDKIPFCGIDNKAFVPGEKLTYTIYYNCGFVWLPAGEVVFDVKEDEENYLYTVFGKTF
ncbi:MAG TPA: hypothetical protein ENK91_06965, partial [Bacteroidetes bacterium]|nr:hypothetical protein [Bacteroidota bacterium]